MGMGPRDKDKTGNLNISRNETHVFATPFALERPKGNYYSAFNDLNNNPDVFAYYTDVVKTYAVSTGNKLEDDLVARNSFKIRAEESKAFLLEELNIGKPDVIFALGHLSHCFLQGFLGSQFNVVHVRHPANGGCIKARVQIAAHLAN